jgi:four helix bundle protein
MSREGGAGGPEAVRRQASGVRRTDRVGETDASPSRERLGHENLDAYRVSRRLAVDLYEITRGFPADERFGLTSQIRRAAVSIPANIAEGAARRSKKEFERLLLIARGFSSELRVLLEIAGEVGLLEEASGSRCRQDIDRISAMLSGLAKHSRRR